MFANLDWDSLIARSEREEEEIRARILRVMGPLPGDETLKARFVRETLPDVRFSVFEEGSSDQVVSVRDFDFAVQKTLVHWYRVRWAKGDLFPPGPGTEAGPTYYRHFATLPQPPTLTDAERAELKQEIATARARIQKAAVRELLRALRDNDGEDHDEG